VITIKCYQITRIIEVNDSSVLCPFASMIHQYYAHLLIYLLISIFFHLIFKFIFNLFDIIRYIKSNILLCVSNCVTKSYDLPNLNRSFPLFPIININILEFQLLKLILIIFFEFQLLIINILEFQWLKLIFWNLFIYLHHKPVFDVFVYISTDIYMILWLLDVKYI
jgi:hypothetical protein